MSPFEHLMSGFAVALSWQSLFYCFVGCMWGTIVGVLPGLGPLAGMVLLLPLTFGLDPANGIIMLTGIFYGAMYGGSTTSILVRIPGEAASVVTCIDGYEMARQGRAGPALMIAAVGSFIGGTVSVLGLMLVAPPLARVMVAIGPSVEVVLMLLALGTITLVSGGSRLKTATMIVLGLAVGTVGLDKITGTPRFTFGNLGFADGLSFTALAIGLFGISEILFNLEKSKPIEAIRPKLRELLPKWADLKESAPAIGRGTIVGFIFGIIPGVSHVVSTFVFGDNPYIPSLGASGAISGVMGGYLVLHPHRRVRVIVLRMITEVPGWVAVGMWFVFQLISAFGVIGQGPQAGGGVAFMAHIGGFVAGVLLVKVFGVGSAPRPRRPAW